MESDPKMVTYDCEYKVWLGAMPGFPGAADTFTIKANGYTIQGCGNRAWVLFKTLDGEMHNVDDLYELGSGFRIQTLSRVQVEPK